MNIRHRIIDLPFHYPFTISKGTKTHQRIFQVELEWRGIRGYGEAPEIAYYNIPAATMRADLENKRKFVENFALTTPDRFWHFLHHLFPSNPFLVCALDIAAWDLYGKLMQKPLYQLFSAEPAAMPVTDYTIGIADSEEMIQKIMDNPWPVYKIKVGTAGDMERLRNLRARTDAVLRVDANAGWSTDDAERNLVQLKELNIELVEQPLAKDDWEGIQKLKKVSRLPLIADESCVKESDVKKCAEGFHGINIKLTKCSGITPARRMITEARSLGLKIMIGCMNESAIGTAAIAHLGPLVDYLDADGPLLLKEDPVEGLKYVDAKLQLASSPGLGINVTPF